jgi:hypothetical protein
MKRKTTPKRLTVAALETAAKMFDQPDYAPNFGLAPKPVQRRHDQALGNARRAASIKRVNANGVQTLKLAGREFVVMTKQQYERLCGRVG